MILALPVQTWRRLKDLKSQSHDTAAFWSYLYILPSEFGRHLKRA